MGTAHAGQVGGNASAAAPAPQRRTGAGKQRINDLPRQQHSPESVVTCAQEAINIIANYGRPMRCSGVRRLCEGAQHNTVSGGWNLREKPAFSMAPMSGSALAGLLSAPRSDRPWRRGAIPVLHGGHVRRWLQRAPAVDVPRHGPEAPEPLMALRKGAGQFGKLGKFGKGGEAWRGVGQTLKSE